MDSWRVTLQNDGMKAVGWLKGESRLIPESDNGVLLEMSSIPFDSAAAMQKSDDQREGLDVIGFLRRRKSFVLLLGICGAIVGYMMFQRQIPKYQSVAWVQVIHRNADPRMKTMLAEKDLYDADYVIKSPKVLEPAFTKHALSQLSTLRGQELDDAVATLKGIISTKNLTDNVVEISATDRDPADIRSIANAVAEEYVSLQKENYDDASLELERLLVKARDGLHESLKRAEASYSEFRKDSRLTTDGKNLSRQRADAANEKVSLLELQKTERKAQLQSLEEAVRRNGSREAILLLVGRETVGTAASQPVATAVNQTVSSAQTIAQELFPLLRDETLMAAELGDDHPKLKALRLQIELTRKHFQQLAGMSDDSATDAADATVDVPSDFLTVYLQSLREELLIIENQQLDLKVLAANEEESARNLMQEEIDDRNRRSEMERLSRLFDETTLQISEIQVNVGMGGVTANVLAPARHGVLVYPVLSQFVGMGSLLGALAGLILGYLVEVADHSFRKPEEMIREFGVPIMGHVPFITDERMKTVPEGAVMDRTAVSVHLPRSRPAEAYRAVRTAVCFSAFGGAHRVLQITSPAAGDGKSTLALNLALSMSQSGKRTILVESDFRRPKVHKLTGVSNKIGFVDVLRGDAELPDAIKETAVPDFFVLPCGQRPKDPAELLSKPAFEQMLQVLRERFDYVIIDSPPVLAVTDPCSVAARVDGVLICMRLSRHTRELGRRTLDQLRDVGATVAGIVINGVEERDAYGYGNYRYSDYRYYYKNYNYKYAHYGSNDAREYYADDTADELAFSGPDSHVDEKI